ncbi:MAG: electron transport complex subunit C [Chlorobiota bacterium]
MNLRMLNTLRLKGSFKGGVHPAEVKELSKDVPFERLPDPKTVYIPVSQHAGREAKPLVAKGSTVKKGELLAESEGFISAPVHSPVSGMVTKISKTAHLSGAPKTVIEISVAESTDTSFMPPLDPKTAAREELLNRIKEAGIVGMGGAAFPMFVKLSPPPGKKIEKLIINAAECEPYLTRDYRLMLEYTDQLIVGIEILMKITGVECVIGIEDNKPEAVEVITRKLGSRSDISVKVLPVKYPQGAEKMLIYAVTGKKVPPGKLPVDVGVVMQNVGTAISVYKAVVEGQPQIEAWVSVTGGGITSPRNLIVPIGTPVQNILEFCGGLKPEAVKVVAGGPMMGNNLYDYSAPVMKATSGLLALTGAETTADGAVACLRCGKCVEVCPVNLMPTRISQFSKLQRFEDAEAAGILVCMECGCCAYECPANIPLVQWIRLGKKEVIRLKQQERKTA